MNLNSQRWVNRFRSLDNGATWNGMLTSVSRQIFMMYNTVVTGIFSKLKEWFRQDRVQPMALILLKVAARLVVKAITA